jgi:hypothetical protein
MLALQSVINDDAAGKDGAPMGKKKPWWADDPEIAAIRRGVMEEIERARCEPVTPDVPDPVLADILSGASVRELAAARDALACAQARYANAVHTAPCRRTLMGRDRPSARRLEAAAAPPLHPRSDLGGRLLA